MWSIAPNHRWSYPSHRTAAIRFQLLLSQLLIVWTLHVWMYQNTKATAFVISRRYHFQSLLSPDHCSFTSILLSPTPLLSSVYSNHWSKIRMLFLWNTADAEEIHKPTHTQNLSTTNQNLTNNNNHEKSWTTVDGGFLPNYKSTASSSLSVGGGIQEVRTLQDYKKIVVEEPDCITVVRFYAPWCRACKAVRSKYQRLSRQYASLKLPVHFVEVPLTKDNAFLHTGLGVPSLPYGHIYHPNAGLVEERKMNKHVFEDFVQALDTYVQGYCIVDYDNINNWKSDDNSHCSDEEEEAKEESTKQG